MSSGKITSNLLSCATQTPAAGPKGKRRCCTRQRGIAGRAPAGPTGRRSKSGPWSTIRRAPFGIRLEALARQARAARTTCRQAHVLSRVQDSRRTCSPPLPAWRATKNSLRCVPVSGLFARVPASIITSSNGRLFNPSRTQHRVLDCELNMIRQLLGASIVRH